MPSQTDIRDEVTARIVEALEADLLPWRRPWRATGGSQPGRHSNVASRKPYQGVNPLLLELHALRLGLLSRWWGTFNQWHQIGCTIRKPTPECRGRALGMPGRLLEADRPRRSWTTRPATRTRNGSSSSRPSPSSAPTRWRGRRRGSSRCMRTKGQPDAQPDFQPAEESDCGDRSRHPLRRRPCLLPPSDAGGLVPEPHAKATSSCLPPKATFDPPGAFYETAIHELAHWAKSAPAGITTSRATPLGELAAEIGSCYVAAELGIPQGEGLGNHAAYLRNWLEALKDDRNYIFKAAKQASKVTDFLLGFVQKPEPEAVGAVQ